MFTVENTKRAQWKGGGASRDPRTCPGPPAALSEAQDNITRTPGWFSSSHRAKPRALPQTPAPSLGLPGPQGVSEPTCTPTAEDSSVQACTGPLLPPPHLGASMFLSPVRLEKLRPGPPIRERPCLSRGVSCFLEGLPPSGGALPATSSTGSQGGRDAVLITPFYRGAQLAEFRGVLTVPY